MYAKYPLAFNVHYTSNNVYMLTSNHNIATGWVRFIFTPNLFQINSFRNNKYDNWSINRKQPQYTLLQIILRDNNNTIIVNKNVFHFIKSAHYIRIKQALIQFGYIKLYSSSIY